MQYLLQTELPFYEKLDFWVFFIIGGLGLIYSILSFGQAKAAKKAAQYAGKIVKIQDILLDIPEIIYLCQQIDFQVDYSTANVQLTSVMGKITKVLGIFRGDKNINEDQQSLIKEIESSISKIQEVMKSLNPVYINESDKAKTDINGYVWLFISPYTSILIPQLNSLSGVLHGQMIQNK